MNNQGKMNQELKFKFDNYIISQVEFKKLVEGVYVTISKDLTFKGVSSNEIVDLFFTSLTKELTASQILTLIDNYKNSDFKIAIALRALISGVIIFISREQDDQKNKLTDLRHIWQLLYRTINKTSGIPINASLGSQGFLSIPLYSHGRDRNISELLRIHFWDKSLHEYPTYRSVNLFSIHSHQFHATSWVLKGNINNTLFKVEPTEVKDEKNGYCFFNIEWDETKEYRSNLKKSFAVNSGQFVTVKKESTEKFLEGQSYEINCGDFHDSFVDLNSGQNAITSTLFLFDGTKGRIKKSDVVGPANIQKNEVIRENDVDSYSLIEKLNSMLLNYQN